MNSPVRRFNIILVILFAAALGCKTSEEKSKDKTKQASSIRFHVQTNPNDTGRTVQVSVFRSQPLLVTIDRNAALDEGYLEKAEVVDADDHGGTAIKLTFNAAGARRLDALTIEHRGKHVAIHAGWTDSRWLAAPLITKRINDGIFIFTPDASREEAERIVNGLQNVIKKLNERYTL